MADRQIVVALLACLAVVGTLALAAWISREVPEMVPIDGLDRVELGALVMVEGTLEGTWSPGPESTVLTLTDGDGDGVDAFCDFSCDGLRPGARVRVTGRVTLYRGDVELVVHDREDVVVLGSVRSPLVGVDELVGQPWAYEGMEPRVGAVVLTDPVADLNGEDWWCLVGEPTSDGAGVLALVGPGLEAGTWRSGERVDLRVTVRYEASSGFVYLEVLDLA
jgi:hypothetical protein